MRKLLVSLAAAGTAMAFATPAAAQGHRPGYGYNNGVGAQIERDIQQLHYDRDNLARSGRLTGREARDVDLDLRALQNSFYQARQGGISPRQADALRWRINRMRGELNEYANNGRDRRYGRR
jgi:hypothetical protein